VNYVKDGPWTYLYLQYVRLDVWRSWFGLCVATNVDGFIIRIASNLNSGYFITENLHQSEFLLGLGLFISSIFYQYAPEIAANVTGVGPSTSTNGTHLQSSTGD